MALKLFLDDWSSIYGDPTKFFLGVIAILFDLLFVVQHYCLYRGNTAYNLIEPIETVIEDEQPQDDEDWRNRPIF